ncbi:hypothetical protein ACLOJK_006715 [Asimina triloba]
MSPPPIYRGGAAEIFVEFVQVERTACGLWDLVAGRVPSRRLRGPSGRRTGGGALQCFCFSIHVHRVVDRVLSLDSVRTYPRDRFLSSPDRSLFTFTLVYRVGDRFLSLDSVETCPPNRGDVSKAMWKRERSVEVLGEVRDGGMEGRINIYSEVRRDTVWVVSVEGCL